MMSITTRPEITEWISAQGTRMQIVAEYSPNDEPDTWVEFENILTGQRYSCRKPAFLARYQPRIN